MSNCKTSPFPLPTGLKLSPSEGDILDDSEQYRRIVGKLLYLSLTRPDISFATQHLSQFLSSPRATHLKVAIHVLRALDTSKGQSTWVCSTLLLPISSLQVI